MIFASILIGVILQVLPAAYFAEIAGWAAF